MLARVFATPLLLLASLGIGKPITQLNTLHQASTAGFSTSHLSQRGLAVRESWEVERGLAEKGRGDYYERVEGYCLTDEQANIYVTSVK